MKQLLKDQPAYRWLTAFIVLIVLWLVLREAMPSGMPNGIIFFGAVQGGLYSLTAIGLVLLYRSQKIVNFSQSAIGGIAVSVAVVLVDKWHVSFWIALIVGLISSVITGAVVEILIIRRFSNAPRLILTVATLGIAQVIGALGVAIPSMFNQQSLISFQTPFTLKFTIMPLLFTGDHIVAISSVVICLALVWWFLDRTRTGIAIRAAADSRDRARLLGIPVKRLSLITWMVAAGLSGVAAMVSAPPDMGNPPDLAIAAGPIVLLAPLAAAVLGRMESLPITALAGILLGVFQQTVFWSFPHSTVVDVGFFVIIIVSLLVQPPPHKRGDFSGPGSFVTIREVRPLSKELSKLFEVRLLKFGLPILILGAAIIIPLHLSQVDVLPFAYIAIYGIVAVSLVILAGWSGQISLGQFGFAGVGAAVTAGFTVHLQTDLFVSLFLSATFGALTAMVVGIPALRISGLFLAVATMAFAVPVNTYLLNATEFPWLNPAHINPPYLFGHFNLQDIHVIYEFSIITLAVCVIATFNLRRGRTGRALIALRENQPSAEAYGINPLLARLGSFAVSGAIAGIAGALLVILQQGTSFSGFDPELSISVFTIVVIGGLGSLSGALFGAIYVGLASYELSGAGQLLATGAGLLLLLMFLPEGLGGIIYRLRDLLMKKIAKLHKIEVPNILEHAAFHSIEENAATSSSFNASQINPVEINTTQNQTSKTNMQADISQHATTLEETEMDIVYETQHAVTTSRSNSNALISINGVDASYSQVQVLFGVNIEVEENSVKAILGTNGAGKSTILRVISGLMKPSHGSITYSGKDVTSLSPEDRVKLGLVTVPGGRGIFASLSVEENLKMAMWTVKDDNEFIDLTINNIYKLFPVLKDRLKSKAWMLSGGEQQMLTLSQSLLCKPKVLLIDELSLGLSPLIVSQLLDAVREMIANGITIVVVEQSINVASSIAHNSVFLERGQVRFDGDTSDLLTREDLLRSIFLKPTINSDEPFEAPPGFIQGPLKEARFEILRVSKRFGGVAAIEEVSLQVMPGEIHGIIGSNGAGKTTLFDLCSGFTLTDHGNIYLDGTDITHFSPSKRAHNGIGRVFQHAGLFPALTVKETLACAYERFIYPRDPISNMCRLPQVVMNEKLIKENTDYLLELLHLERFRDSFISELSTGTRRIVELACALAHRPLVLLLDEPSSGLAQKESESLGSLLNDIRNQTGASLLVIEHDVPLVSSISDTMTCLHLGEVLTSGKPGEVLSNESVVASYLGTDNTAIFRSNAGSN